MKCQLLRLCLGGLIQAQSLIGVLVQALDNRVACNKGTGVTVDIQLFRLCARNVQVGVGRFFASGSRREHC